MAVIDALDWRHVGTLRYLWVMSPFLLYGLFRLLKGDRSVGAAVAGMITAGLMLLFTGFIYFYCLCYQVSSTSVLVFLFAPLWLNVGWPVTFVLSYFIWVRCARRGNLEASYEEPK